MPSGKKEEESGASSEWLNTYADMVTLVLTFFVLLFAMSNLDVEKFRAIASSFTGTPIVIIESFDPFGDVIDGVKPLDRTQKPIESPGPSSTPLDEASAITEAERAGEENALTVAERFDELFMQLQQRIKEDGLDEFVSVNKNGDVIVVRFADSALFTLGDAVLREEAYPIVYAVAQLLERNISAIESISVEGHTDNIPINTDRYPDNRSLSSDRAVHAVRYIEQVTDIDPSKLKAIGMSEYHPIDTNDTAEGRARNRRVEFVIERRMDAAE